MQVYYDRAQVFSKPQFKRHEEYFNEQIFTESKANAQDQCYLEVVSETKGEKIQMFRRRKRLIKYNSGISMLGEKYIEWEKDHKGLWYENAINHFNPFAIYYRGSHIANNDTQGALLYQQAANLDLSTAVSRLGECYRDGRGVVKDKAKALELFCRAEQLGAEYQNIDATPIPYTPLRWMEVGSLVEKPSFGSSSSSSSSSQPTIFYTPSSSMVESFAEKPSLGGSSSSSSSSQSTTQMLNVLAKKSKVGRTKKRKNDSTENAGANKDQKSSPLTQASSSSQYDWLDKLLEDADNAASKAMQDGVDRLIAELDTPVATQDGVDRLTAELDVLVETQDEVEKFAAELDTLVATQAQTQRPSL